MRFVLCSLCAVFLMVPSVWAQGFESSLFQTKEPVSQFQASSKPEVSAVLVPAGQPGVVQLQVKLVIPPGANSYSQAEFPKPTKIEIEATGWKPVDASYGISPPPKKEFDENFGAEVEKIFGTAIFSRRFTLPAGTNLSSLSVKGTINFLYCDKDQCRPQTADFTAKVVAPRREDVQGEAQAQDPVSKAPSSEMSAPAAPFDLSSRLSLPTRSAPAASTTIPSMTTLDAGEKSAGSATASEPVSSLAYGYEMIPVGKGASARKSPIKLQFELSPKDAKVGETVTLAITMTLDQRWSTYALERVDETQIENPTQIKFEPENLKAIGSTVSVPLPQVHTTTLPDGVRRSNSHENQVTWKQQFEVIENAPFGVSGSIRYQVCEKESACLPPRSVNYSLGSAQQETLLGAVPISKSFVAVQPDAVAGSVPATSAASSLENGLAIESNGTDTTLFGAMFSAFFAGLLMNILPCVLPVLAIKIISFVQQAGESRMRIIGLNLAYTAGVMAVFLVFAVLSVLLGQSLSSVFQNTTFMIVMSCVIFTMGLSLFGVFELPVPGIIPSAHHHNEGYSGAFVTGTVATLLGTPCIGPFVAPVFTWSLGQPPVVVFAMFGLMGLGMAFPFLLTGVFPALVNWLPRPGNWMVGFKQFTGFVMMGTVIWLLLSVEMEWRVPVLVLLLALALFVWLCANLSSPADPFRKRMRGYVLAAATGLPVFVSGLWMMQEFRPISENDVQAHRMPWKPFTEEQLVELRKQGKPMLIDFTANWCVICKVNEKIALDREETIQFVKENGFTPMMADFTKENPEILKYLRQFGQDSVPLTIIIPPGKDSKIIALRGQYTQSILLDKLKEAMFEAPIVSSAEVESASVLRPTLGVAN
ncbi:cytochrome c biogenesis protein CcdA [Planctomicrobium sp. SH527]|uniref:protein-disulfide reductase DsbD family protein n=1 Tax=Planctomicrobium sp. SH527 TaxID=3448123 RepID=UPI003F5BAE03